MKFFDKDFFKFTFQFLLIISVGVAVISYISSMNSRGEVTAGVVDIQQ